MDSVITLGTKAVCSQCNKEIVFVGPYWDHPGDIKPKHPAWPVEEPKAGARPLNNLEHWTVDFGGRELEEIKFARTYHQRFGHGTPGHLHLLLISQLSRRVDILCGRDPNWDKADW